MPLYLDFFSFSDGFHVVHFFIINFVLILRRLPIVLIQARKFATKFEELANDSSSAFFDLSDDSSNDLPGLPSDDFGVASVFHKENVYWETTKSLKSQAKFFSINLSLYHL